MHVVARVLLLHYTHVPEALDALFGIGRGVVVPFVAGVGVDLLDAQGEEGEGQEFEAVFCFFAVGHGGEESVLCAGFFVGGRFEGADGAFDCACTYQHRISCVG